ncbi:MAG TPA: ABC transporter substrate-binding protein [Methanotrichaceae archaeon]|nr:ABC transporter substrate-binding protein [Methanotrichaceae archaeon]
MNREVAAAIAVIAIIALAGLGGWSILGSQKNTEKPVESIRVAYSPFESCALFLVAEDLHFFTQNGLNLTLYRSDSGAAALEDMLNGKADLAVSVSEFPLVKKVFQGIPVCAVASIDRAEYIFIVARKDRGIENPSDLRGKQIGTATGSIAEFNLGRFLSLHGLEMQDIQYVSLKTPLETSNAVVDGDLDAAVLAQPYADQARDRLDHNAIIWPAQNNQPLYALVVSADEWVAEHPEHITRFLQALAEAEEYTNAHPAEARAIVQRSLNLDAGYMDTVWQQNQFSLSLDQSLITAMEDEGRWMIKNNLTTEKTLPYFRDYIYTKELEEIKPDAVNIR